MREWQHDEFIESLYMSLEKARAAGTLLHITLHNHDENLFMAEESFDPCEVDRCVKWVMECVNSASCLIRVAKAYPRRGAGSTTISGRTK